MPINKKIAEANKLGQYLVQSAAVGVDTNDIELQLEKLNSLWNKLQESVSFHTYLCFLLVFLIFKRLRIML